MKKITIIFGTRPEAIKLAPIIIALKKKEGVTCNVCVTGQHREMLDQVLEIFDIIPDIDLNLMLKDQSLGMLTSRAILAIDRYLAESRPDIVLVQGDTTTSFCGALAAFYQHIPVGHVEAGLRTGNIDSPWPEEANRLMITRLAKWHFCPTNVNRKNLLNEGIDSRGIFITGNTVIDALLATVTKIKYTTTVIPGLPGDSLGYLSDKRIILITGHRRENFGFNFENICNAIVDLVNRYPDVHFVYPVHPNPNIESPVNAILRNGSYSNLHLIEPLAYNSFVALMYRAYFILTDSGGVQEEAPTLGKPVLVMRDTTERIEALDAGTVKLIGTDKDNIVKEVALLLDNNEIYQMRTNVINPYGDGHAASRILTALEL